jgi:vacuolar-type H+-ATPase subunit H
MLPDMFFQLLTIAADLAIFGFIWYYLWALKDKQKWLDEERKKTDTHYHHVVDEALAKERKILDDATREATQIIKNTEYLTTESKTEVEEALQKMEEQVEKDAGSTSHEFTKTYSTSLQKLANQSLLEYQHITRAMGQDLQEQTKKFKDSMLPQLQKELDDYKKIRLQQAERTITHVIQEVSQEILNKSLSLEDHQGLLIEALEKAKKEGAFD